MLDSGHCEHSGADLLLNLFNDAVSVETMASMTG
jgi:hypothetical protein